MVIEGDTGLDIEDGRVIVTVQVGGDQVVLGVCENTYRIRLVTLAWEMTNASVCSAHP